MILKESIDFPALSLLMPCLFLCLQTGCTAPQTTGTELEFLQGTWEGVALEEAATGGGFVKTDDKVTITIDGNSLHFHRDTNFWFETTFSLPAGKEPRQLHATIQGSSEPSDDIGEVVVAFFKIEDGTLTLAGIQDPDSSAEQPENFEAIEDTMSPRYELRKIQSQK